MDVKWNAKDCCTTNLATKFRSLEFQFGAALPYKYCIKKFACARYKKTSASCQIADLDFGLAISLREAMITTKSPDSAHS